MLDWDVSSPALLTDILKDSLNKSETHKAITLNIIMINNSHYGDN